MSTENTIYTLNKLLPLLVAVLTGDKTIQEVSGLTGKSIKHIERLILQHLGGIIISLSALRKELKGMQSEMAFCDDVPERYMAQIGGVLELLSSFTDINS